MPRCPPVRVPTFGLVVKAARPSLVKRGGFLLDVLAQRRRWAARRPIERSMTAPQPFRSASSERRLENCCRILGEDTPLRLKMSVPGAMLYWCS